MPHSVINGFKNLLAVAAVTDVEFKEAETVKEFLKVCFVTLNVSVTNLVYSLV